MWSQITTGLLLCLENGFSSKYVKKNIHALTLGCMHMLCKCFSFVLKMLYDTKYIKDLLPEILEDLGIQALSFKSLSSSCGSELRLSPFLVTEQQGFLKQVLWAGKVRFCGLQALSQCSGTQGERK